MIHPFFIDIKKIIPLIIYQIYSIPKCTLRVKTYIIDRWPTLLNSKNRNSTYLPSKEQFYFSILILLRDKIFCHHCLLFKIKIINFIYVLYLLLG